MFGEPQGRGSRGTRGARKAPPGRRGDAGSVADRPVREPHELVLCVRDPEVLDELERLGSPREREAFALAALRVGAQALRAARGQVDADGVRREVDRMLGALEEGLAHHREGVQSTVGSLLREYFDPESGRFAERVQALVREDGELERAVRSHVEGEGSALARTLAAHLGAESPLLRKLDPESGDGLVQSVRGTLERALVAQQERVLAEFSLDNREGSLARLVTELRTHHGALGEQFQARIDEVVREFSLDDEGSALSRLVSRVERASAKLTEELSLDHEDSALARLRRELTEVAGRQTDRIAELEKRLAVEVAALATRRDADAASTAHGLAFEEALLAWLAAAADRAGDVCTDTRHRTGLVRQRKVGDAVIELGPEHQAAGARIVFEAKDEGGLTLARAREELDLARRNRGAELGVFVLAAGAAGDDWPPFRRVGSALFVVWDAEDARSDVFLEAALSVARTLCTRSRLDDRADLEVSALEKAVREVERQAEGLDEIGRANDSIEKGNERIRERVRKMRAALLRAVETLDRCTDAVRGELRPDA